MDRRVEEQQARLTRSGDRSGTRPDGHFLSATDDTRAPGCKAHIIAGGAAVGLREGGCSSAESEGRCPTTTYVI